MLDPNMVDPSMLDSNMLDPSTMDPSMTFPPRKRRSEMTPEEKAHDNHLTRLRKMATGKLPLRPGYAITPPQGISPRPAWAGSFANMGMDQERPGWMPKKPRHEMTPEEKRIDNKERKAREMYKKMMRGEIPRPEGGIFPHTAPKLEVEEGITGADPLAEPLLTEDPFLEDPPPDTIGDPFSEPILDPPADPDAMDSGAATGMLGPLKKRRADMTPEERRINNKERKMREAYKKAQNTEQKLILQQQLHQVPRGGCLVQPGPHGPPSLPPHLQRPRRVPAPRTAAQRPLVQAQLGGDMRWPQPAGLTFMGGPQGLAVPGTRKRKLRAEMTPEEKRADNAERRARAAAKQASQAVVAGGGTILPVGAEAAGIADIGLAAPTATAGPLEPQWLA